MKTNFIQTLILTVTLMISGISFSQDNNEIHSDITQIEFSCYVGDFNEPNYPITIMEYKYAEYDIDEFEGGKTFPLLSVIKSRVNSEGDWYIISNEDTTKIINSNLSLAIGSLDVSNLEMKGEDFSKEFNSKTGIILHMTEKIIMFSDSNGEKWNIIKQ